MVETVPQTPAKPVVAPPAPAKPIGTQPAPVPQKAVGETDEDMIEVKALRPYLGAEDKRAHGLPGHADNEPYSVTRRRAAELRANGLADYVDPKDHDKHVDGEVQRAGEATRKKFEVKR